MRLNRPLHRFAGVAAFVAALLVGSAAFADDQISEEAKLYFKNGVELLESQPPNYQDAYYQFKLAYDKSQSWKVLGNLGLCSLKLERDGEAIQYYKEYLDRGGKDVDPEERAQLERDLLLVNGNTATVTLTSTEKSIEITDSRVGSSAPPQTYKLEGASLQLRLRAGTHVVTAAKADGKTLRWDIALSPGKVVDYKFDFSKPPEPPPDQGSKYSSAPNTNNPPPPQQEKGGSGLRTAGYVTTAIGGAALIGGVVVRFVLAPGKADDAKKACNDKLCPESAESDFDSANSMAKLGGVLMIGGGVVAVAGVTMIVLGGSSSTETAALEHKPSRLRLIPAVSSNAAGLWATGSF